MARAFAIDPTEWPKIVERLVAKKSTAQDEADKYDVSIATIHSLRRRLAEENQKASTKQNGGGELLVDALEVERPMSVPVPGKLIAPTNGATHKLLSHEASTEIVMPQIMEWIGGYFKAMQDPASQERLRRSNQAIMMLAAKLQAELL